MASRCRVGLKYHCHGQYYYRWMDLKVKFYFLYMTLVCRITVAGERLGVRMIMIYYHAIIVVSVSISLCMYFFDYVA
jgi:hypothetical protein